MDYGICLALFYRPKSFVDSSSIYFDYEMENLFIYLVLFFPYVLQST